MPIDLGTLEKLRQNDSTLTALKLGFEKFKDEDVLQLAEALSRNTTLLSLNLKGATISAVGVRKIAVSLPESLVELNLECTGIDDEGAATLAKFLPRSSLIILNLNHNKIGENDEGVVALAEALPKSQLIALSLRNNLIDAKKAEVLTKVLPESSLVKLSLTCGKLTDTETGEEGGIRTQILDTNRGFLELATKAITDVLKEDSRVYIPSEMMRFIKPAILRILLEEKPGIKSNTGSIFADVEEFISKHFNIPRTGGDGEDTRGPDARTNTLPYQESFRRSSDDNASFLGSIDAPGEESQEMPPL